MRRSLLFKILLVLIDVVVLSYFIVACYHWFKDKKSEESEPEVEEVSGNVTFKNFNYDVPDDIGYRVLDDDRFILHGDDYLIIVLPFRIESSNGTISENIADFEAYMLDNGLKISSVIKKQIGTKTIYLFNKSDVKNTVLGYYDTGNSFAYELELVNDDDSFDTSKMDEIIEILENAKYDGSDGTQSYYTDFEVFHKFDKSS